MRNDPSRIYAHRGIGGPGGYSANSLPAYVECLEAGFSLEIDIRSEGDKCYVSHDPSIEPETWLSSVLSMLNRPEVRSRLALDVKQDGMLPFLPGFDKEHFYFDMSVPEQIKYIRAGKHCYGRLSEFEPYAAFKLHVDTPGIWLDAFESDWFLHSDEINALIPNFPGEIVVVSPELHGRPYQNVWKWIAQLWSENENLSICTDKPFEFWDMVNVHG